MPVLDIKDIENYVASGMEAAYLNMLSQVDETIQKIVQVKKVDPKRHEMYDYMIDIYQGQANGIQEMISVIREKRGVVLQ